MQTLTLALAARGEEGEALPSAFKGLDKLRAYHRRGQVSLVAAAPGGGKSAYATHMAIKTKVPTLYMSADSDRLTLGTRALAGLLNASVEDATTAISNNDDLAMEILSAETEHIWWNFNTGISTQDIVDEITAYAYVYGEYPSLLVVDNLKDMVGDADNQRKYHECIDFLHTLARETGAHVMILHHTVGQYEDGNQPIPLSGLLNKVGKSPRLVLTFYKQTEGVLTICIVKNSVGPKDAAGNLQLNVAWLPERSFFSE